MKTLKEIIKQNDFSEYDFGTGIWSNVNKSIEIKMNSQGEYINNFTKNIDEFTDEELILLKNTNSVFSDRTEDSISKDLFNKVPNIKYNKKIGYYLDLYAGYVREGDFRENASSGGFGTWIFKELIEQGYVDGIIHVKESSSDDLLFEYGISKTIEEISAGSKTKYYPVEMSKILNLVKKMPGKYAIIGLPSFVMDIRLLTESDPIFKERIRFIIGLVCGHQKSTKFADFLAWQCGVRPGTLKSINFRKKNDNLPSDVYGIEVTGEVNGISKTVTKNINDIFGYDWGQAFFKVRASDFTDDVMNETADVTLGDAWLPNYTKDSKGNNIIIVRNPTINKIIKNGIMENRVNLDRLEENDIILSQIAHFRHTQDELGYRLYKKESKKEWFPHKRINPNNQLSFFRRKVQDLREKICMRVPVYYQEAVDRNDFTYFVKKMQPIVKSYRLLYFLERVRRKLLKIISR